MGLKSMGLADNIVNMAFGLGEKDAAKQVADSWASKITK